MRRKDREVLDGERIDEIIRACEVCRLGFADAGEVYIVPLNFGYRREGERRSFFFHSAAEGRKLELIRRGGSVGFELDCGCELVRAELACSHSTLYSSVIGAGRVRILEDPAERDEAMREILSHLTGRADWELPEAAMARVCLFRLDVEKLSCKEHRQEQDQE